MNAELLKIKWRNRRSPLAPSALAAFDEAADSLAEKLLSFADEDLETLQGVSAKRLILLTGAGENLPWTNGAIYLGRDARMPFALLPTTVEPNLPLDLLTSILNANFGEFAPFAVLPGKIIPFGAAKTLSRGMLEKFLAANR